MHFRAEAIVTSVRAHGEHNAIVRALTEAHGLQAGYVRGGRSTRMRPILQPANLVMGEWRARTEEQLASLTLELTRSRAPLFAEPLPAAALDWATALTAAALPEGQPYPRLYVALEALLEAIEAAPAARGWAVALARYELLLLTELGYGPDAQDVPPLFAAGGEAEWADILHGLRLTGRSLARDILTDRRAEALAARERLIDRLKRAVA